MTSIGARFLLTRAAGGRRSAAMSARASDSIVHRVTGVCLLSELYALCNSCNSFRLVLSFHRTRPAGPPSGGGAAEHACASTRPGADDARPAPGPARTLVLRCSLRGTRPSTLRSAPSPRALEPRPPSRRYSCIQHSTLHGARGVYVHAAEPNRRPSLSDHELSWYVVEARGLLMHRVRVAVS